MAVVLWNAAVPLLGHRHTVTGGPSGRETLEIGLAPGRDLRAGRRLPGWALLAFLERLLPRSVRLVWAITAVGVLLVSFAALPAPGTDVAIRIILGALHVAVATVLIPAMTRTAAHPALTTSGDNEWPSP